MYSLCPENCILIIGRIKHPGASRRTNALDTKWFIKKLRDLKVEWNPFIMLMILMLLYGDLIQAMSTATSNDTDTNVGMSFT